jgi:hypothetical protein
LLWTGKFKDMVAMWQPIRQDSQPVWLAGAISSADLHKANALVSHREVVIALNKGQQVTAEPKECVGSRVNVHELTI